MAKNTNDRLAQVLAAVADERSRFNKACKAGARPVLPTFVGPVVVTGVTPDFWFLNERGEARWAGANDQAWADLLAQAGVERHPLFGRAARAA